MHELLLVQATVAARRSRPTGCGNPDYFAAHADMGWMLNAETLMS